MSLLSAEQCFGQVNKVREGLYIGDLHSTRNTEALEAEGITAILSCVMPDERYFIKPHSLKRCHICIQDSEAYPFHWLTKALEQLDLWLQDGEKVLVHCAAGISRSASTVIAHLIGHGLSWDEAEAEVRAARPIIMPHAELKKSILTYYKIWPYDGSMEAK